LADEVRLWRVGPDERLREIDRAPLNLESRLQEWLTRDISMLDPELLVIGREVETDFGGFIDILCVDTTGDLVIVELKRDKTPREISAQVLDYASWVVDLSNERVSKIADAYLGDEGFESAFRERFGAEVPETLNGDHRLLVVGSRIDASSERIIKYLSDTHGVNINAVTFQYFREPDGSELVARVFLIGPEQVELHTRSKRSSKRRPPLTYAELEALAEHNNVTELYRYAVAAFEQRLQKHTTRSSIGFVGSYDGSRRNVVSLLPGESDSAQGLRFQIYRDRFAQLAGLQPEEVEHLMPGAHEPWIYYPTAGPDYEGFQGFFRSHEEVNCLVEALRSK